MTECANLKTGNVRIKIDHIRKIVSNKIEKSKKYDWGNVEEKWLLISAPGLPVQRNGGPMHQNVDWADPELVKLCQQKKYDKIYYYDPSRSWYKPIWPEGDIVDCVEVEREKPKGFLGIKDSDENMW